VKASHQVARLKYLQDPKLCSEVESVAAQYDWKEIPTGIKRSFHCYWSIMTLFSVSLLLVDSMYSLSGEFCTIYCWRNINLLLFSISSRLSFCLFQSSGESSVGLVLSISLVDYTAVFVLFLIFVCSGSHSSNCYSSVNKCDCSFTEILFRFFFSLASWHF
jgi:hypothetical protein